MITKTPRVGAILFDSTGTEWGRFMLLGRITKITNTRICYHGVPRWEGDLPRDSWVARWNVKAVCDTKEEMQTLMAFSRRAEEQWRAIKSQLDKEEKALFSPSSPRRTVRFPS
jgi:hypothetical protein